MNSTNAFFALLYEMIIRSLHFHHETTSYAEHKALGEFYSSWIELSDKYIETYQGKYGRVELNTVVALNSYVNFEALRAELYVVQKQIDRTDTDLLNIIADMIELTNHTIYLLTLK